MTTELVLIFTLFLAIVTIVYLSVRKKQETQSFDPQLLGLLNDVRKEIQQTTTTQRKEMEGKLDLMHERLVQNMQESSSTLQKHFSHTSGIIRDVTEKLTKLDETNKQVLNFSGQLQSLENILKNPKQRGILGEYWLETLLGQVLQPGQYKMQYDLGIDEVTGNKLIPDSVIFIRDYLIPIDAKFSLENYNRIGQEADPTRREV